MPAEEGCRVVRGPAWDYGDQDGGEGGVGTVIEIGSGCFDGWVVVVWDYGFRARYRIGSGNKFDLLVLDNSFAGVKHRGVRCCGSCTNDASKGETTMVIRGMRWRCSLCPDVDLCTACYMSGEHQIGHPFLRIDVEDMTPFPLPARRGIPEAHVRGLYPGAPVRYRPAYQGDTEGAHLGLGEVVGTSSGDTGPVVEVQWGGDSSQTRSYRLGEKGRVDIKCTKPANGWPYIRDHLPLLGQKVEEPSLRPGDRVTVAAGKDRLKELQKEAGLNWFNGIEKCIGRIGFVNGVVGKKVDITYQDGLSHSIHESALEKISRINVGDKVRIKPDKGLVKRLLQGHGGWNDDIVKDLGKDCRVVKVDRDGDLRVKMDRGKQWSLHPGCVTVVKRHTGPPPSKEESSKSSKLKTLEDGDGLLSKLMKLVGSVGDKDTLGELLAAVASSKSSSSSSSSTDSSMGAARKLHRAVAAGDVDRVKDLITENPEAIDEIHQKNTPLMTAIAHNELPVVQALVELGADLTKRDGKNHGTVLHHATEGNHADILAYLLPRCQELIDIQCDNGFTPLHVAAFRDRRECGELLVVHNCDLNKKDRKGNTPLFAALDRKVDDIDYLLDSPQLDAGFTNKKAFNMLHQAAFHNATGGAQKILQRHPEMIFSTVPGRQTPLHIAAKNNYTDMIEIMISQGGANINAVNANLETPLHMVCEDGKTEGVELLLGYSADVNLKDKLGDTPLHMAATRFKENKNVNETPTLKELQEKYQGHGITSAQGAFLVLLVRNGSKLDPVNKRGKTPLDLIKDEQIKALLQKLHAGESVESSPLRRVEDSLVGSGDFIKHVDGKQEADAARDFEGVHRIDASELQMGSFIGKGAFGVVKRGTWRGTPVAIKIISRKDSEKRDVEREVAVHKNTRHPNIVRMMALSHRPGETLLVMQLVEGSSLQDAIFADRTPPKMALSWTDKLQISVKILQALWFLHESSILHLDIKPSNIIIEKGTKMPYLCDLGLAHMKPQNTMDESTIGVRGTIFYMPPEGLRQRRRGKEERHKVGDGSDSSLSAASDVWSISATLLEMFTEKQLWGDEDVILILARLIGSYSMPPNLKTAKASVRRILEPALAEEPEKRPTAGTLMKQFEELS